MKSVYGQKRMSETWMDRFTQLEPDGGFGVVVRKSWSTGAATPNGASRSSAPNVRAMKPVYGQKSRAGARETWMDRFARLKTDGGFRAAVEHSRGSDAHLTTLAA
jgi:hypothetical protein